MDNERKEIYYKLFKEYEENHFKNDGIWNRTLNLIFGFADWIDDMSSADFTEHTGLEDVEQAKAEINKGIDKWLEKNHKNLFY